MIEESFLHQYYVTCSTSVSCSLSVICSIRAGVSTLYWETYTLQIVPVHDDRYIHTVYRRAIFILSFILSQQSTLASQANTLNLYGPGEVKEFSPTDILSIRNSVSTDLNLGAPGNYEDNNELLEGDIIIDNEQRDVYNTRKGIFFDHNLWPTSNGVPTVHYRIGSSKYTFSGNHFW